MTGDKGTVLITGASSGIGEALAGVFASHGHNLVLVARSAGKLKRLASSLALEHEVDVHVRPADLSEPGSAQSLAGFMHQQEREIDILVNNAGVLEHGAFVDMPHEDIQNMVQLNVAGLTDLIAHFLPDMVARGSGRILNVASIASFMPIPSLATYAATKAYVLSLSEALAEELRGSGVTVTALCPGVTDTPLVDAAKAGSSRLKMPRLIVGDTHEVATDGYRACMKGTPVVVPGSLNLASTLGSRSIPKWLVRRLGGLMGRATLDSK